MIADRFDAFHQRLAEVCAQHGRNREDVTLVAVSKTYGEQTIRQAYDWGQRHFGESRIQEALPKIANLPGDIVWHLVGQLQSNKAKKAAQNFNAIHSVDNPRQLEEIAKADRMVDIFIQINLTDEAQKSGISVRALDNLLHIAANYQTVRPIGLMTIGRQDAPPAETRALFHDLAALAHGKGLKQLSMGMSGDWEIAVECGATHLRVGSALFGDRG